MLYLEMGDVMNHRSKVTTLTLAISALAIANMTVHTGSTAFKDLSTHLRPDPGTCKSASPSPKSKKELKEFLGGGAQIQDVVNCSNCWLYTTTGQNWCQHLLSVCHDDPFPWHENFEKERTRYWYKCPGLPPSDVFSCSGWIDSGCCGSSDPSEPVCPGTSGNTCIPGTEPAPG